MCGIAAIVGEVDEHELRVMTQMQFHRGPDDGAIWINEKRTAGLGHRRLSIIDRSAAGRQPMISPDGRFVLTYNGEIFNYRELRMLLEKYGHRFRSRTDSEVLLHGYMEWGKEILDRLVGQFAFVVWDEERGSVFAARDHLGIKPLYYCALSGKLYVASEAKAILAVRPDTHQINWKALPSYLAFLWTTGDETFFHSIRKLQPGHWMTFEDCVLRTEPYWTPLDVQEELLLEREERTERFYSFFSESVQSQLMSEVPIGLLLSGGIDSTAVLSAMGGSKAVPEAFTATYSPSSRARDVFEDDRVYAQNAANRYGAHLTTELLRPSVGESLPKALWHLDEPLADPTIITNLEITAAAKKSLTVLLSGMGADEILAGYPRYPATILGEHLRWVPKSGYSIAGAFFKMTSGAMNAGRSRRFSMLLEHLPKPFIERFLGFSSYMIPDEQRRVLSSDVLLLCNPDEVYAHHLEAFEKAKHRSKLKQMLIVDLLLFLPNLNLQSMEKTGMANSVELRVPFLDHRLVEFALALPDEDLLDGTIRKAILRRAMPESFPKEILRRTKTGFSPPVRSWVRHELRDEIHEMLLSQRTRERGLWNEDVVREIIRADDDGERDNAMRIWELFVIEQWFRVFFDAPDFTPDHDPLDLSFVEIPR